MVGNTSHVGVIMHDFDSGLPSCGIPPMYPPWTLQTSLGSEMSTSTWALLGLRVPSFMFTNDLAFGILLLQVIV